MDRRVSAVIVVLLLAAATGFAKTKKKPTLPPYLLTAHTVAVIVDPDAGISIDDPRANQVAQKDVETALVTWGRFEPVMGTQVADLIIVIRRGNGNLVNQTIGDPRQNNRAGVINPTDNGAMIGAQHGPQPNLPGTTDNGSPENHSPTQTEIGYTEDSFTVYEGNVDHPLDSPAGWRYIAKDGLRPHSVPAVAEFRKALAEADKAAAAKNP
jgi:hypothetical protein